VIVGIGTDVVEVARMEESVRRTPRILQRVFTEGEAGLSMESLAARFAAKEALSKALGSPGGLAWTDAEVVSSPDGAPSFVLHGTVAARAEELGITRIHLSLTHDAGLAMAFVVCESTT
jgi:holo-[acyl-carrier protein] synthase